MNFKTILILAKHHFTGLIITLLAFSAGWLYLEHKKELIEIDKDKFSKEQIAYAENKAEFEVKRNSLLAEEYSRKEELYKRELDVKQAELANQETAKTIELEKTELDKALVRLQADKSAVSAEQSTKEAELKIEQYIHEFSNYGVDLDSAVACNDKDGLKLRAAAEAKYLEIRAFADAWRLNKKYNYFFERNSHTVWNVCPESRR